MSKGLGMAYAMKRKKMMSGGMARKPSSAFEDNVDSETRHEMNRGDIPTNYGPNKSEMGKAKETYSAMEPDEESTPYPADVDGNNEASEGFSDLVKQVMGSGKLSGYSKGGMIADGGEDDLDEMADGKPNNFDDLALSDDLDSHYTGENSGDLLGNPQEEEDRDSIVSRIMHSLAKKDRMPRPT